MKIEKGIVPTPIRAVIYGPEGIGKSTLASHFPAVLFFDCEAGTSRLPVDRVKVASASVLTEMLESNANEIAKNYKTIVIDTADALDWMLANLLCTTSKVSDIEDFGYGKGYAKLAKMWESFLGLLTRFSHQHKIHIVLVAHAQMRKFEEPNQTGTYDRWELKCMKQTSPLLKAWADTVLFVNYKTTIVFDENKKAHATGAKRVIYTNHAATWDAKNRFGFPDEMPLPANGLPPELQKAVMENTPEVISETETTTTISETENISPADKIPVPETPPRPLLDELKQLAQAAGISSREIQSEVAKNGVCPADMPIGNYNDATLRRIISGWSTIKQNILNSRNN